MKNNRSPGYNGFTPEFFKCVWSKLGHLVVRSINFDFFNSGTINYSKIRFTHLNSKTGQTLPFKKDWRPLSLLNTVYKIASGSVASRIKTVLSKLINVE